MLWNLKESKENYFNIELYKSKHGLAYHKKYHKNYKLKNTGSAALRVFMRHGKLMWTLKIVDNSLKILHYQWHAEHRKLFEIFGWNLIFYYCFFSLGCLFEHKVVTIKRKAGTRRLKYSYRYKYLEQKNQLMNIATYFNKLQYYFYHVNLEERLGSALLYIYIYYYDNYLKKRQYKIGNAVLDLNHLWYKNSFLKRDFFKLSLNMYSYQNLYLKYKYLKKNKKKIYIYFTLSSGCYYQNFGKFFFLIYFNRFSRRRKFLGLIFKL